MVRVIARMELNPGCREQMLAIFRKYVPLVQAEQGCISYEPCLDVRPGEAGEFITMVECWESEDCLQAHLASAHMAAYREEVKDLRKGNTLYVLRPAL